MEPRITELEIKLAYAEDLLDGLNHTVYRQQERIERLERELRQLRELVIASQPNDQGDPRDEIPPHY
jgi:SlyX protein